MFRATAMLLPATLASQDYDSDDCAAVSNRGQIRQLGKVDPKP